MIFTNERQEIEGLFLSALMNSNGQFSKYRSKVSAEHFSSELHKKIFQALLAINQQGGNFNMAAIKAAADLSNQESCDLVEISMLECSGCNAELYLRKLVELIAQEKIENFKLKKYEDCFSALDEMQRVGIEVNQLIAAHTLETKQQQLENFEKYLQGYQSGNTQRIKTPFPTLTGLLEGGFSQGSFVLVGGVPGSGKTSFALQCALTASQQSFKTFFLEAEMPMHEVYERCCGILTGFDIDLIRRGEADASDALAQLKSLPIEFYFDTQRTFKNLINQVELAAVNGAQFVCVDFMQTYSDKDRTFQDEFLSIKKVSESLRRIALKYNTVLFVLSSLNRNEATVNKLTLNSFYGSSQLGHDCTQAMILESVQNDAEELDSRRRKLTLRLLKSRTGPRGVVPLVFQLNNQRMFEEYFFEDNQRGGSEIIF